MSIWQTRKKKNRSNVPGRTPCTSGNSYLILVHPFGKILAKNRTEPNFGSPSTASWQWFFQVGVTIPYEFERYIQLPLGRLIFSNRYFFKLEAINKISCLIDVITTVNHWQLRSLVRNDDTPYDTAKDLADTIRAHVQQATLAKVIFSLTYEGTEITRL